MPWMSLFVWLAATQVEANDDAWVHSTRPPYYFAVDVGDVDTVASWYQTVLGVHEVDDTSADDGRWRIANLANDDFRIELIWDRRSSTAEGARVRGFAKLGVTVADVRTVADRVRVANGERPRVLELEQHGIRLLQLRDPEGNTIQLHSPLEEPESDEAVLLQKHRDVLQYHIDNDLESWMEGEADDYISANGGELSYPTLDERRAGRGPYLKQTTFSEYRDLVEPVVRVSEDGTLGWVICQVQIMGERREENGEPRPVHSVWAWIELYAKQAGNWVRVGNVSNQKLDY